MKYRPVDQNGDLMPCGTKQAVSVDADAVLEAVKSRLHLFRGEWWENDSIGFAVPDLLIETVRISHDTNMLSGYITAYIAQTPGVASVDHVDTSIEGHKMTYACSVTTIYDPTEREVITDVVL